MRQASVFAKISYWGKVIVFGLVVGLGLQIVSAWNAPVAPPTGGNVAGPLTTASIDQTKAGRLSIGTTDTPAANLSLRIGTAVGADAYCDETGGNCTIPSDIRMKVNEPPIDTSTFLNTSPEAQIKVGPLTLNNILYMPNSLQIQGSAPGTAAGDDRNLAIYADQVNDRLHINYNNEYDGGVCISGICRTDWSRDALARPSLSSYNIRYTGGQVTATNRNYLNLGPHDFCGLTYFLGLDGDDIDGFACNIYFEEGAWHIGAWAYDFDRVSCGAYCMDW